MIFYSEKSDVIDPPVQDLYEHMIPDMTGTGFRTVYITLYAHYDSLLNKSVIGAGAKTKTVTTASAVALAEAELINSIVRLPMLCVRANSYFLSTLIFLLVSLNKIANHLLFFSCQRSWIYVEINVFWFFN